LGLNVLGKSNGGALMKPFVSSGDADPFVGLALTQNHHGIPQLSDALAFLACELRNQMPAGDHTIYLCEVIDGGMPVTQEKDEPMIRIRANGFGY
jgi:flavin reductase (DIM6/NTAB) family NADH-FMN oxidoreductase RutF